MLFGFMGRAPEAALAGIAGAKPGGRPVGEAPERSLGVLVMPPVLPEACASSVDAPAFPVAKGAGRERRAVAAAGALRLDSMPMPVLV